MKEKSRKMHAFCSLVFLVIVLPLYVQTQDIYLPLVLIVTQDGQLQYPNQIIKADIKENIGFTGATRFSTEDSKNQIFFCAPESDEQKKRIEEYNELLKTSSRAITKYYGEKKASGNCLFGKQFKKKDPLRCAKEANPVIYLLMDGEPGEEKMQKCGSGEKTVLNKFVYELCAPINPFERFINYMKSVSLLLSDVAKFARKLPFVYVQKTVYEICYNHETGKTIYTKHTPSPVTLLFDEQLEHEKEKKHIMMTEANKLYFGDDFSKLEEFYQDLLKNPAIKKNQSSKEETADIFETHNVYLPEKLVPPDDFMLAVLKKATFHYINVQPMHQNLVKLWNYMAELIRKSLRHKMTENPIQIYTGAFTPPEIDSHDVSSENWPSGVPKLWIKIIYHQTSNPFNSSSLVIVMRNDDDEPRKENLYDYVLDIACGIRVDHCKSFKQNVVVFKKFSYLLQKIRCCPLNKKIANFFNKYFTHGNTILPIDGLTDEKE